MPYVIYRLPSPEVVRFRAAASCSFIRHRVALSPDTDNPLQQAIDTAAHDGINCTRLAVSATFKPLNITEASTAPAHIAAACCPNLLHHIAQ